MLFKPTVTLLIEKDKQTDKYHQANLCSRCEHSIWILTQHSTFPNAGTIQEYMQKFIDSLNPEADSEKKAEEYYRCYCKVLHEYHDFCWFDKSEYPHIIESCDDFRQYEPLDEFESEHSAPPRPGKRNRPTHESTERRESVPGLQSD